MNMQMWFAAALLAATISTSAGASEGHLRYQEYLEEQSRALATRGMREREEQARIYEEGRPARGAQLREDEEHQRHYEAEAAKEVIEGPIRYAKELRALSRDKFCAAFGNALRGDLKYAAAAAHTEANRRELSFNSHSIRSKEIRMGMSECELYASWGHPNSQNRTVGSWGVHIQHVYRDFRSYVYTENGRVTSWQD